MIYSFWFMHENLPAAIVVDAEDYNEAVEVLNQLGIDPSGTKVSDILDTNGDTYMLDENNDIILEPF